MRKARAYFDVFLILLICPLFAAGQQAGAQQYKCAGNNNFSAEVCKSLRADKDAAAAVETLAREGWHLVEVDFPKPENIRLRFHLSLGTKFSVLQPYDQKLSAAEAAKGLARHLKKMAKPKNFRLLLPRHAPRAAAFLIILAAQSYKQIKPTQHPKIKKNSNKKTTSGR